MTGAKPGNLSYLDRTKLVEPYKEGNPKRPTTVIYTVEQVLQIKIIERLRERISLQEIRKVLDFLAKSNYKPSLFKCNLFMIGSQVYLIEDDCNLGIQVREASGKNKGQIVIHDIGPIGDVIAELRKEGTEGVVDFPKRAKGTLLDVAA
jgi:DNA-binding transcriptional MerR regulator